MTRVLLIILDGYGYRADSDANAIALAEKPFLDRLEADYPHRLIETSGLPVGLPRGTQGNSEVGHLNIGAGSIITQDITRVDAAIESGEFRTNPELLSIFTDVQNGKGDLHLMGLLGDGGVHSHLRHLEALIDLAAEKFDGNILLHMATDGRDTPPDSGIRFIRRLLESIEKFPQVQLASIIGRFYLMDRDRRWERLEKAYTALVNRVGRQTSDPTQAIEESYLMGITDEFLEPTLIRQNRSIDPRIKENDGIIFFNFRADRAREITSAFVADEFPHFPRRNFSNLHFLGFSNYQDDLPIRVAFPAEEITNTLTEVVTSLGHKVYKTAETEKYAHVTYFFNGGREKLFPGETQKLIPSPKVETYDLTPEMNASKVTDSVIKALDSGEYSLIVVNFANPDMVGHTGILEAASKAINTIDGCLDRIWKSLPEDYKVIITADHGNAELMVDPSTGIPHTAHTLNPVPFFLLDQSRELRDGPAALRDIAPTILELMGIDQPESMSGTSLISK